MSIIWSLIKFPLEKILQMNSKKLSIQPASPATASEVSTSKPKNEDDAWLQDLPPPVCHQPAPIPSQTNFSQFPEALMVPPVADQDI